MTRNDDFIGQLQGYLDEYEGSTPLPNEVRDAIRAELPSIQQRPAWWPARRFPSMNNTAKLAFGAAAVLVVALLSFTYFVAPNVGGPGLGDPLPTAAPTPTPRPMDGETLEPGTYALAYDLDATITVPAGWTNLDQRGVLKEDGERFMGVLFWPFPDDLEQVYTDPCNWATNVVEPPVGPTVDDLANALAAQAIRGNPTPTDVTIDGYDGKLVEMSVPSDVDFADCDLNEFRSWSGRFHHGPGQIDRVYILDVDGERLVLIVHHMPGATAADLEEQQAIFESIDFLP
jgi:hypothetical protein